VNRSFPSFHWIYWVGPITGTILAVIVFKLVKALEYETAHGEDDEVDSGAHQPYTEFKGRLRAEQRSDSILPVSGTPRTTTMEKESIVQKAAFPVPTIVSPANEPAEEKKWETKKEDVKGDPKDEKKIEKRKDENKEEKREEQVLPDCYAD
jgi:aquaporin related protein